MEVGGDGAVFWLPPSCTALSGTTFPSPGGKGFSYSSASFLSNSFQLVFLPKQKQLFALMTANPQVSSPQLLRGGDGGAGGGGQGWWQGGIIYTHLL